jgi:hypothetical protein
MQTMANFFESINRLLGVGGPGELIFHPVFIGVCILLFLYALARRRKILTLGVGALMGFAAAFHYLYPRDSSNLTELLTFLVAVGLIALFLVYFAFVRE